MVPEDRLDAVPRPGGPPQDLEGAGPAVHEVPHEDDAVPPRRAADPRDKPPEGLEAPLHVSDRPGRHLAGESTGPSLGAPSRR